MNDTHRHRENLAEVLHARIDGDYLIDTGGYEADLPIRQCGPADVVRWALNALIASDALAQMLAEARERGHVEGYEKGLLDPGSAWMKANAAALAEARAEALRPVAADLYRNHDMPPQKDSRSYSYRNGWWDGVHHAAKVVERAALAAAENGDRSGVAGIAQGGE